MPTINKDLAEQLIGRVKTQKRPKTYCVVRYKNRPSNGKFDYAYCDREDQYQAIMRSPFIGGVDVLWASKRFTKLRKQEQQEEDWKEAASYF